MGDRAPLRTRGSAVLRGRSVGRVPQLPSLLHVRARKGRYGALQRRKRDVRRPLLRAVHAQDARRILAGLDDPRLHALQAIAGGRRIARLPLASQAFQAPRARQLREVFPRPARDTPLLALDFAALPVSGGARRGRRADAAGGDEAHRRASALDGRVPQARGRDMRQAGKHLFRGLGGDCRAHG